MPHRLLDPTPLVEAIPRLPELAAEDRDRTLYVEPPLALATVDSRVVTFELDEEDAEAEDRGESWAPDGYEYLLEVDIAAQAAEVLSAWRAEAGAPAPGAREQAAAVVYYAIFDAWLPVGEESRPAGGWAEWGGSGAAAAEANLQTASELLARFPDRDVPTREEQWSVRAGDVVEVRVWFASTDGPRPETRPVRIDSVEDDLIEATAVGADVHLRFRHDHVVRLADA